MSVYTGIPKYCAYISLLRMTLEQDIEIAICLKPPKRNEDVFEWVLNSLIKRDELSHTIKLVVIIYYLLKRFSCLYNLSFLLKSCMNTYCIRK